MNRTYIALGSNLADPLLQVNRAVEEISELGQLPACSSWYRSAPVGPQDQPDFINGVLALETNLSPIALLDALQAIEKAHERIRERHWGPRTLDLDILLYNEQCIDEPRLTIPHPYLAERSFVVIPLHEIAPTLILPNGKAIEQLAREMPASGLEKLP